MNFSQKKKKYNDYLYFKDFDHQQIDQQLSDEEEEEEEEYEEFEEKENDEDINNGNSTKVITQSQSLYHNDNIDYDLKVKLSDTILECEKYNILWAIYIDDLYDQFDRYLKENNGDPRNFVPVCSPEVAALIQRKNQTKN